MLRKQCILKCRKITDCWKNSPGASIYWRRWGRQSRKTLNCSLTLTFWNVFSVISRRRPGRVKSTAAFYDPLVLRITTKQQSPPNNRRFVRLSFAVFYHYDVVEWKTKNVLCVIFVHVDVVQHVRKTDTVEPSPDQGVRLQLQHRRGLLQADDGPSGPQVLRRSDLGSGVRQADQRVLRQPQEQPLRRFIRLRRLERVAVARPVQAQRIRLEAVVARRRLRTRGKRTTIFLSPFSSRHVGLAQTHTFPRTPTPPPNQALAPLHRRVEPWSVQDMWLHEPWTSKDKN